MDTNVMGEQSTELVREWDALTQRRTAVQEAVKEFRNRLMALPDSTEMRQYLEAKELQEKGLAAMRRDLEGPRHCLSLRTRALTNGAAALEVERLRASRIKALDVLKGKNAASFLIANAEKLLWQCVAPIADLQARVEALEATFAAEEAILEHLRVCYQNFKRTLRENLRSESERLARCEEDLLNWATQDRRHLDWYLERQPQWKERALQAYRAHHPEDDLRDLLPPPSIEKPRTVHAWMGRVKTPVTAADPRVEDTAPIDNRAWQLIFTNAGRTKYVTLPLAEPETTQELRLLLRRAHLSVTPELLLKKLHGVTAMSLQQRQELPTTLRDRSGAKVIRAGSHRVFLEILESDRVVRFYLSNRADAYRKFDRRKHS